MKATVFIVSKHTLEQLKACLVKAMQCCYGSSLAMLEPTGVCLNGCGYCFAVVTVIIIQSCFAYFVGIIVAIRTPCGFYQKKILFCRLIAFELTCDSTSSNKYGLYFPGILCDYSGSCILDIGSISDLPTVQFLMACSMQQWRGKP